jgi:hypothetical protein
MESESLKTLLIVLAVGLVGLAVVLFLSDGPSPLERLAEIFEGLVGECQTEHPTWTRLDCERIVRHEIWEGMTGEMLVASLGEPRRVEHPVADDPSIEEWTYLSAQYGEETMRLEDGLLVKWTQVPCESCAAKPPRE